MTKRKSDPVSTQLDPSHPNYDAILLKRSRLEAHRRRRLENQGDVVVQDKKTTVKPAKKRPRPRED